MAESKYLAEYRFNSCGHRAGMECGPKPLGTYRIVMIGSSMAMGLFTPREKTFAALLPPKLAQLTGRKVEIYNEASGGEFRGGPFPMRGSTVQFKDVLAQTPDMVLWVVTPMDVENATFEGPSPAQLAAMQEKANSPLQSGQAQNAFEKLKTVLVRGTFQEKLRFRWDQSRTALALKHIFYGTESQQEYVESYLKNEDDAGFLRTKLSPKWQSSMATFESYAAVFESDAKQAHIPFVVVLVPNRAQAAMISMGSSGWPTGYDPYKLDGEMRAIIERHGGTYVDVLPEFAKIPNPERHFFPVDGHPDAEGHAMLSDVLADGLTSGAVPDLAVAGQPKAAREQER
jgi:hypothetical protein